jgi:hypothetical protein
MKQNLRLKMIVILAVATFFILTPTTKADEAVNGLFTLEMQWDKNVNPDGKTYYTNTQGALDNYLWFYKGSTPEGPDLGEADLIRDFLINGFRKDYITSHRFVGDDYYWGFAASYKVGLFAEQYYYNKTKKAVTESASLTGWLEEKEVSEVRRYSTQHVLINAKTMYGRSVRSLQVLEDGSIDTSSEHILMVSVDQVVDGVRNLDYYMVKFNSSDDPNRIVQKMLEFKRENPDLVSALFGVTNVVTLYENNRRPNMVYRMHMADAKWLRLRPYYAPEAP